jgi:tryptophan halogenase
MDIPDTLQFKIDHFRKYGRHVAREMDLFGPPSWLAVHIGQLNIPEQAEPMAELRDVDARDWLAKLRAAMAAAAQTQPTHREFINQHCKAPPL